MKRASPLLLAAALLLALLPACRGPAAGTDPPVSQGPAAGTDSPVSQGPAAGTDSPVSQGPAALDVVNTVLSFCGFDGGANLEYLSMDEGGSEFLTAYLENAYGLAAGTWEDAAVIRATGPSAFELTVLRLADDDAAIRAAAGLMSYIFSRQGDFAGYAPAQADMVAAGSINQDGPYAALFICPDTAGADAAFAAAVNGGPLPEAPEKTIEDVNVKEMRDFLVSDLGMDGAELIRLDDGDPAALEDYMLSTYGLTRDLWEECAIAYREDRNMEPFEIVVVYVSLEVADKRDVIMPFKEYLDAWEAERSGRSAQLLHDSYVYQFGRFIILAACWDSYSSIYTLYRTVGTPGGGLTVLTTMLRNGQEAPSLPTAEPEMDPGWPNRIAFVPPNEDDMSIYDTSAIRAAWEAGNPSGLSNYDRDIYNAARNVLSKVLKDGMSDLEKETALYSWVVNNVNYDWTHQDIMAVTPRESFTPYGGLVNHTAVCLGYATTFQLLCDLAGVECITVVGAAFRSTADHAWNMVRLNSAWYCVDVTWDANYREQGASFGRERDWDFFNITSDDMAINHQWDYANTPEAVTEGNGRD